MPDGLQQWIMKTVEQSTAEKVAAFLNEGVPQQEIAELLGVAKGTVSKAKTRAIELGLLKVSCIGKETRKLFQKTRKPEGN